VIYNKYNTYTVVSVCVLYVYMCVCVYGIYIYMYNHYTFFLKFQKFLQNYMRESIIYLFIHTYTSLILLPRLCEKTRPVSQHCTHRHTELDRSGGGRGRYCYSAELQ